ncbi:four helix bundle protein [Desulfobacter postgatei]|uniref:four helix bundle protein n=1 Tax=Desulfobacter postgatei TaxID=2293 RepID=UPI00259B873E|nr:four helix bundle protein [uncultured Desulfobacter sp.]
MKRGGVNHWKDLVVWRKSHELVLLVYKVVGTFAKNEQYDLADQIKRAAASVPANIVEGHSRNSQKDFLRFLYIARGSLEELRYFLLLSRDLKYVVEIKYNELENTCTQTSKLLNGLIKSLKPTT